MADTIRVRFPILCLAFSAADESPGPETPFLVIRCGGLPLLPAFDDPELAEAFRSRQHRSLRTMTLQDPVALRTVLRNLTVHRGIYPAVWFNAGAKRGRGVAFTEVMKDRKPARDRVRR